jgi:hypothetical protein
MGFRRSSGSLLTNGFLLSFRLALGGWVALGIWLAREFWVSPRFGLAPSNWVSLKSWLARLALGFLTCNGSLNSYWVQLVPYGSLDQDGFAHRFGLAHLTWGFSVFLARSS